MWPKIYEDRLRSWIDLRVRSVSMDLEPALLGIDQWWQKSPWRPYYLHWDDRRDWPDPWQLLADNVYCDLARALGMLYTIRLLQRPDCADATVVWAEEGNLVLVQQGKYIVNWMPGRIVNIQSNKPTIKTVLEPAVLESLIR